MGIVPGIQYTSRRIAGQRSSLQGHYSRQILVLAILFSVLVYMDSFPAYTSRRITGRVLVYKGLFSAYTSRRITSQRSSLQGHCFRHKLVVGLLVSLLVYTDIVPGKFLASHYWSPF